MATPTKTIVIGSLILAIFAAYFLITMPGVGVRLRIDNDKSTFYILEGSTWKVAGIEYTNLYNGSKLVSRYNVSGITREYTLDQFLTISRTTRFGKGDIIVKESWMFDPNATDVESFPIDHKIECLNCKGLILQYEVQKLGYVGPTVDIESPFIIGKMRVLWSYQPDDTGEPYLHKIYSTDKLWLRYKIMADYATYSIRLFDSTSIGWCYQETVSTATATLLAEEVLAEYQNSPYCISTECWVRSDTGGTCTGK